MTNDRKCIVCGRVVKVGPDFRRLSTGQRYHGSCEVQPGHLKMCERLDLVLGVIAHVRKVVLHVPRRPS